MTITSEPVIILRMDATAITPQVRHIARLFAGTPNLADRLAGEMMGCRRPAGPQAMGNGRAHRGEYTLPAGTLVRHYILKHDGKSG